MNDKPIAQICQNGMIKFYTPDGRRNEQHPTGFNNKGTVKWLESNGYTIVYSHGELK
jgi:hypothetical protein